MLDSEKWCTFLICSIISLQVVLQVLHLYFIKKRKGQDYVKVFTISFNNLSYLGEFSHENKANCFTYNLLKSWISCKVFLIFSLSFMISNIVFIAFIVFFRKPFFNRITNSTFHKKQKDQELQKSFQDHTNWLNFRW